MMTYEDADRGQLIHGTTHDALSGLLNRPTFERIVAQALARVARRQSSFGMFLIDLDGFTSVNDRFGRGVGNVVLRAESNRLVSLLRTSDTAARVGAGEFAVLREGGEHRGDVITVGRHVIDATERPFEVGGEAIELGASVGLAFTHGAATTVGSLFRRADCAMREAKRNGGSQIAVYDETAPDPRRRTNAPSARSVADREHALPIATSVEVRDQFCGKWSRGFSVTTASRRGYRLRRTSDQYELPGEFSANEVRRVP
jgi:diguanylate cyclase (GGDEF)-like protein